MLFGFIALCILGQPLQDGCRHTRACWGYGRSADCQADAEGDNGGALKCFIYKNAAERESLALNNCGQHHWDHFEYVDNSHENRKGVNTFEGFATDVACRDYWSVDEKVHEGRALVLVTGLLSFVLRAGIVYLLVSAYLEFRKQQSSTSPSRDVLSTTSNGAVLAPANTVQIEMATAVFVVPVNQIQQQPPPERDVPITGSVLPAAGAQTAIVRGAVVGSKM
mmetsp:Transcript_58215/g.100211  ORF Transcript_58215/g.100211 Transcript_58215/m.100211 type:complete len:222 (+) Transcript_58215:1-666(+)